MIGKPSKISREHWLKSRRRTSEGRGSYISEEETNLCLSWLASLGELDSSTANKFKILVSRHEVYRMYLAWGVKSILYLMTKIPRWQEAIEKYAKKQEYMKELSSAQTGEERGLFPISLRCGSGGNEILKENVTLILRELKRHCGKSSGVGLLGAKNKF